MKVIIFTQAYNAQNTLKRTIKSVLSQTYTNWVWYIVDNGSNDATGGIVQEYASRDSRIIPLKNEQNNVWKTGNGITEIISEHFDSDYVCWIDADDTYKPDFLKKLTDYAMENELDLVASGNDFIDAKTDTVVGVRVLNHHLVIENEGFSKYFTLYHQFTRTYWAKIFSVSVLRRYESQRVPAVSYGWDTLFTQEMFRNVKRAGILAESLYEYYVSPKSVSYHWDSKRIASDRILHKMAHDFLVEKCGTVIPRNEEFLLIVYMKAIKDTLNVLLNAKISENEKLTGILDIFSHEYTKQLAAREQLGLLLGNVMFSGMRRQLFADISEWLLARQEVQDELVEQFCNVGEFVCAAAEYADGWIFFQKLRVSFLIDQERKDEAQVKLIELEELLPNDGEILAFRETLSQI